MEENKEPIELFLSIEDGLTLSTILDNIRSECILHGIVGDFTDQFAYRLLNSAIDPIIEQLETELAAAGAR